MHTMLSTWQWDFWDLIDRESFAATPRVFRFPDSHQCHKRRKDLVVIVVVIVMVLIVVVVVVVVARTILSVGWILGRDSIPSRRWLGESRRLEIARDRWQWIWTTRPPPKLGCWCCCWCCWCCCCCWTGPLGFFRCNTHWHTRFLPRPPTKATTTKTTRKTTTTRME